MPPDQRQQERRIWLPHSHKAGQLDRDLVFYLNGAPGGHAPDEPGDGDVGVALGQEIGVALVVLHLLHLHLPTGDQAATK